MHIENLEQFNNSPVKEDVVIFGFKKTILNPNLDSKDSFFRMPGVAGSFPPIHFLIPSTKLDIRTHSGKVEEVGKDIYAKLDDLPVHLGYRKDLEADDIDIIHPISYVAFTRIVNDELQFYVYQRTKGVGEKQLVGNYSVGIGGHIDIVRSEQNIQTWIDGTFTNLLEDTVMRELEEEVSVFTNVDDSIQRVDYTAFFLGCIYDTSNTVGKRHLGFLYHVHLPNHETEAKVIEEELIDKGFLNWQQISEMDGAQYEFEQWSRIAMAVIRERLGV